MRAFPSPTEHDPAGAERPPRLREPLGWRSLSDKELDLRASELAGAVLVRQAHPVGNLVVATPGAAAAAPAQADAAAVPGMQGDRAQPDWSWLPVLLLALSLMVSTPVLLWAPLAGGVCFGLVLIQAGLLRTWLRRRAARWQAQVELQARHAADVAAPADRLPRRDPASGWLLLGFLSLAALLAGVVLGTLYLKSQEPAAAAERIRVQQERRHAAEPTLLPPAAPALAAVPPPSVETSR